jgi:hypothetical protein
MSAGLMVLYLRVRQSIQNRTLKQGTIMYQEPTNTDTMRSDVRGAGYIRPQSQDQGVLMIAVYHYVIGAVFLLATFILALPTALLAFIGFTQAAPALLGMFAVGLVAAVVMAFSLLFLATGYGLWSRKQWARVAAITLAFLTLLLFPLGTIVGGLILWHLLKSEVAAYFV